METVAPGKLKSTNPRGNAGYPIKGVNIIYLIVLVLNFLFEFCCGHLQCFYIFQAKAMKIAISEGTLMTIPIE